MQVDTFGSADPYVCVSAISDVGDHAAVTHNPKAQETHLTKDGIWEMHPQHKTKTIKNELNPVFDEDFVLSHVLASTVATNSLQAKELVRQDLTLLLTVHDWNRVGHDVLMGVLKIKVGPHKTSSHETFVLKAPDLTHDLVDKLGKPATVLLTITWMSPADSETEVSRELPLAPTGESAPPTHAEVNALKEELAGLREALNSADTTAREARAALADKENQIREARAMAEAKQADRGNEQTRLETKLATLEQTLKNEQSMHNDTKSELASVREKANKLLQERDAKLADAQAKLTRAEDALSAAVEKNKSTEQRLASEEGKSQAAVTAADQRMVQLEKEKSMLQSNVQTLTTEVKKHAEAMAQAQAGLARLTAEKDQLEREFSNTNDALKVQLSATQAESKEKMRETLEAKGKVDAQVETLERQLAAKTAELEKYRDKEAEAKLADPTKEAIALINSLRTSIQGRKETMTQIRTAGSQVQEAMDHLRSTVSSTNRTSGRQ